MKNKFTLTRDIINILLFLFGYNNFIGNLNGCFKTYIVNFG